MAGPSGATPNLSLPYPVPDDSVDVPRDIQALATALDAGRAVPVGSLLMWPTAAPPTGFLVCNGSTVSSATYPALAAVLGEAGGLVTLPDLRDTFPVGAGPTMALGSKGGAAAVTLSGPQSGVPGSHARAHARDRQRRRSRSRAQHSGRRRVLRLGWRLRGAYVEKLGNVGRQHERFRVALARRHRRDL
jgi:hypothetical protein